MKSGVYQIKNLITDKCYIGSAVDIKARWREHRYELLHNKHHSKYLQRSFNKRSMNDFEFNVLFTCPEKDLIRIEQYCIDNYNSKYNMCKIAGSTLGKTMSEESRKKMSASKIGVKWSEERKNTWVPFRKNKKLTQDQILNLFGNKCKSVCQVDINTFNVIKMFESVTIAANYVGGDASSISKVLKNKTFIVKGYTWCYSDNYNKEEIQFRFKNRIRKCR